MPNPLPIARPDLTPELKASFSEGRRLALVGRSGSGRLSAIRAALPKVDVVVWDYRFALKEADLHRLAGGDLRTRLRQIGQTSARKKTLLVLRNIDGFAGASEENAAMGLLRSEVQGVSNVRIFYTVSDQKFVGRHFGSPTGAFFKQAVILPVPDFNDAEIDELASSALGCFWDSPAKMEAIAAAGRRARDITMLTETIGEIRHGASASVITLPEVRNAIAEIVRARGGAYDDQLSNQMPPSFRTVLHALASGLAPRASKQLVAATGIPAKDLTSVLRGLLRQQWLVQSDRRLEFADPFLRCYLSLR